MQRNIVYDRLRIIIDNYRQVTINTSMLLTTHFNWTKTREARQKTTRMTFYTNRFKRLRNMNVIDFLSPMTIVLEKIIFEFTNKGSILA